MKIANKLLSIPLIQGGMGIGISLSKLAGAVAKEGAMGVVSAINPGYREPDFKQDNLAANSRALTAEIEEARRLSNGHGLIGVNIMCAINQYKEMVQVAAKAKADALICGAGLPLNLPELVADKNILLAPIVSSARAARTICEAWRRRYQRFPDFLVLEGPLAGGHLGFKWADLKPLQINLEKLLKELVTWRKSYTSEHQIELPVFAAGGIRTATEVENLQALGAAGVQVGTPFIATFECDAPQSFKDALISATEEDIRLIESPVGMPARAIQSPLLRKLDEVKRIPPRYCVDCLKTCDPRTTKYCINEALQSAITDNPQTGLFFSGARIDGLKKIVSVRERIREFFPQIGDRSHE
ncbi:MAG: nitronate monooxygenase [Eubacteriales bacterium]|nr:nitronate monooxygenase [Eubacteriales bacterium]